MSSSVLSIPTVATLPTEALAGGREVRVLGAEGVAVDAVGLHGTAQVRAMGDWFEVGRVRAAPIPAEVVELQTFGDRADEVLVGQAVDALHPTRPAADADHSVAVAAGPSPEPAVVRLDGDPSHQAINQHGL